MARNRYIKSHSNYTLKALHQNSNIGNIYERDYNTISEMNTFIKGGLPVYDLSSFKMVYRPGVNFKKKYKSGSWVMNDSCGYSSEYWTENCNKKSEKKSTRSDFKLKPNSKSLLDFACFGSVYKMIYSSVNHVLTYFPAEVVLLQNKITENILIQGTLRKMDLYKVDNEFDIDFHTVPFEDVSENGNELRVFSKSYDKYEMYGIDGIILTPYWEITAYDTDCPKDNELLSIINIGNGILLYNIWEDGKNVLYHNGKYKGDVHIKPYNVYIEEFFDGLDDFEKVMLNRDTNYTMTLNTPQKTNKRYVEYEMAYQWPVKYTGWNLDVSSESFVTYINSLYNIANFYDDKYTDNLWRSLTHESIINLDWSFLRENESVKEIEFDSSRIEAFIKIAGRQFDNLKLYSDGIKNMANVSYNGLNNFPDIFLSNRVKNKGWETKNVLPFNSEYYITDPLYENEIIGKNADDANVEFLRRLMLNSRYIQLAKGTKKGLEMMLSLFGFRSLNFIENSYHDVVRNGKKLTLKFDKLNDSEKEEILSMSYDMNEFVYVAGEGSSAYDRNNIDVVKYLNRNKSNYSSGFEDYDEDELQGLPIREVETFNEDGEVINNYFIPWFDKGKEYDGKQYFESKGGWGYTNQRKINDDCNNKFSITLYDGIDIYDETINYLKFVETIDDLANIITELPSKDSIYYVYDLSGYNNYDFGYIDRGYGAEKIGADDMSHFFILKDENHDDLIGFSEDRKNLGWKNITKKEIEDTINLNKVSRDVKLLAYIESIEDDSNGNNPHCGFGKYDGGRDYISNFENIFKGAIDNKYFSNISDDELPWVNEDGTVDESKFIGYNIERQIDNVKCWYFEDSSEEKKLSEIEFNPDTNRYETVIGSIDNEVGDGNYFRISENRFDDGVDCDDVVDEKIGTVHLNRISPYNVENPDNPNDEAAANSIINSKLFNIFFHNNKFSPMSTYNFINDIVMFYVKQLIPSTTLLQYNIFDTELLSICENKQSSILGVITEDE